MVNDLFRPAQLRLLWRAVDEMGREVLSGEARAEVRPGQVKVLPPCLCCAFCFGRSMREKFVCSDELAPPCGGLPLRQKRGH